MSIDLPPPPIDVQPLPYEAQLQKRDLRDINLVVIHCTELPDLQMARQFGEKILYDESQTGNSGHFYIDRDGAIYQYVNPQFIAHHTKGFNATSIGIELVNVGRYPNWLDSNAQRMEQSYTDVQIRALTQLLSYLRRQYPHLHYIAGHEDLDTTRVPSTDKPEIDVARKMDPGPLFPWSQVMSATDLKRLKLP